MERSAGGRPGRARPPTRPSASASGRAAAAPTPRWRVWRRTFVEDGVVPRDKLPEVVRRIQATAAKHRVKAYLLFHAGDGNIHPNIIYDERDAELTARVMAAGHEMLQACVELGGSLSGEHGIGLDKRDAMAWLFTPQTLALFRRVKDALDCGHIANPDKLFPEPGEFRPGPGFIRPKSPPLGEHAGLLVERVKSAPVGAPFRVRGASTRLSDATAQGAVELLTTGMSRILDLDRRNYTLTVESGISLHARELGTRVVISACPRSEDARGLLAARPWPSIREDILGCASARERRGRRVGRQGRQERGGLRPVPLRPGLLGASGRS